MLNTFSGDFALGNDQSDSDSDDEDDLTSAFWPPMPRAAVNKPVKPDAKLVQVHRMGFERLSHCLEIFLYYLKIPLVRVWLIA